MELPLNIVIYIKVSNIVTLDVMIWKLIHYFFQIGCWRHEPSERPDMQKVVLTLKTIISPQQNDTNIEIVINEENEDY